MALQKARSGSLRNKTQAILGTWVDSFCKSGKKSSGLPGLLASETLTGRREKGCATVNKQQASIKIGGLRLQLFGKTSGQSRGDVQWIGRSPSALAPGPHRFEASRQRLTEHLADSFHRGLVQNDAPGMAAALPPLQRAGALPRICIFRSTGRWARAAPRASQR